MTDESWLLEMRGISKRFGALQALDDVNFEANAGEVVALVGDNGAGKSTLIKAISGINPPDEGEIRFDGRKVGIPNPKTATSLGIATVYQDLALCDNLDVVANLFLGQELLFGGVRHWMDELAMEIEANRILEHLAVMIPSVRTPVASLSGGQRQSVAVARTMMGSPKLVILDEPTAALGVAQTHQVLELVKRLRDQGTALIYISHNLPNVFAVSDRIVVLRLGRRVADYVTDEITAQEVVGAIAGAHSAELQAAFKAAAS